MRPFQSTISIDEARRIIRETVRPVTGTERVAVSEARGRVLASPAVASHDVPPFSRAAMDGYAVVASDVARAGPGSPVVLRCIEQVFTGQMPTRAVSSGACAEVATGAPMPEGADCVVMVEETTALGTEITFHAAARPGQNIGRQGQDIAVGQVVLAAGVELNASRIGALAALGLTHVEVYVRPRVAILSTGNEIVPPGQALRPGELYDINSYTLTAVALEHGSVPLVVRTAADTIDDLTRAVDECPPHDVLVLSGGSSVGTRDLVLDVLRAKGDVLFHGIAVKPGKPTAFGRIGRTVVFGMPGYPASCLSNAYILLAPALRQLARLVDPVRPSVRLPLGARVISAPGRHQFCTVRIKDGVAQPAFKASGDITSMSEADGYIEIDADTDVVEPQTLVDVKFF